MQYAPLHRFLQAELKKHWLLAWRYPAQALAGVALAAIAFVAFIRGIDAYPALQTLGADRRVTVAAFFGWLVAVAAVGHVAAGLEEDIKANMLEPLFLSRWPVHLLLLTRSLAHSLASLGLSYMLLAMLAWIAGADLRLGLRALLALLVLNLTLSGIGLVIAGLVIVYKRASLLTSITYLACGAAVVAAISARPDDAHVPYPVLSAIELFARSVFGSDIPAALVCSAAAWCVALLAAGAYALHRCARRARRDGTLAQG